VVMWAEHYEQVVRVPSWVTQEVNEWSEMEEGVCLDTLESQFA